jgi:hypothetical protein
MISAISSISPIDTTYSPSIVAQTESPDQIRQDSIDVIDHYGVAPAYVAAVAYYAPAFVGNHNADVVSAAAPVVRTSREPQVGSFLDTLA